MDEQHAIDSIRADIRDLRKDQNDAFVRNDAAHGKILDGLSADRERIVALERGQDQMIRSINTLVRTTKAHDDKIEAIEILHAEERGRTRRVAASIGGGIAAIAVAAIELLKRVLGG